MGFRTIQHKILATNQFAGAAPGGALARENDMEAYAANAAGGLFDFANTDPVEPKFFAFHGGGQASWALVLVDADSLEYPLLSGTNETAVFERLDHLVLLQGQKLKLTTVGATLAMTARITIEV